MSGLEKRTTKFYSRGDRTVTINAAQGHFATGNSHVNYYVDATRLKIRVNEAKNVAAIIKDKMVNNVTTVDTIVCLDNTQMLGGFIAQELETGQFLVSNTHATIYVITPDENSLHQFMFRSTDRMGVGGKNCLILAGILTTGETISRIAECIEYYGGMNVGVAAIFSTMDMVDGLRVFKVFDPDDLPGYATYKIGECPYCAKGIKVEAIVNGAGYAVMVEKIAATP
ncbi:MAG: hypothetical protein K5840_03350, partial [Eubacterium sp.]|nr:hypothetical protein [Eubacterium sp.]